MKLQDSDIPFLRGEKFNNNLVFPLGEVAGSAVNRLEFLRQRVAGKRVIHIGCVDHLPLIEEKRKRGLWLHELLVKSAALCAGIDINKEGCDYLRQIGFSDIYCTDAIRDPVPENLKGQKFDFLILGEMIEHVDNPVEFLTAVRNKFGGIADRIILTTPNAFRFQNLIDTLRGRERINSDHRFWFTPYTLAKILSQAGFADMDILTVWYDPSVGLVKSTMKGMIGSAFPAAKDCLIAEARMSVV